jgi:2-dehydro-3-deoxygalactonokinase
VSDTALIGLDWGTTFARAYRIDRDGTVLDVRAAPLGIQNVRDGAFAAALDALLGDWRDVAVPRLACGMIGSRQGWIEAPYCDTPASLAALGDGLARVPEAMLAIVPGVRTRDAQGMPDVMRGEETQVLGAIEASRQAAFAVLPGTHSKWARVEDGRLTAFTTFMTGEVYAALLDHTILGRLAERAEPAPDAAHFSDGVARGLAGGSLLHDVFGARTRVLAGELAPSGVAPWLSGVLIGQEIAAARAWAPPMKSVTIVADGALGGRYAEACVQAGLRAAPAAPHAAARGLWRIALATARV